MKGFCFVRNSRVGGSDLALTGVSVDEEVAVPAGSSGWRITPVAERERAQGDCRSFVGGHLAIVNKVAELVGQLGGASLVCDHIPVPPFVMETIQDLRY